MRTRRAPIAPMLACMQHAAATGGVLVCCFAVDTKLAVLSKRHQACSSVLSWGGAHATAARTKRESRTQHAMSGGLLHVGARWRKARVHWSPTLAALCPARAPLTSLLLQVQAFPGAVGPLTPPLTTSVGGPELRLSIQGLTQRRLHMRMRSAGAHGQEMQSWRTSRTQACRKVQQQNRALRVWQWG